MYNYINIYSHVWFHVYGIIYNSITIRETTKSHLKVLNSTKIIVALGLENLEKDGINIDRLFILQKYPHLVNFVFKTVLKNWHFVNGQNK